MIVAALVKRYEDTLEVPVGWQKRDVSYALDIDERGRLLDVILLEWDEAVGKKNVRRKKSLTLPLEFGRQSPKAYEIANFLCDDGNYMLGLDPLKFEAARKFHERLLSGVDAPQARAVIAYFNAGIPQFPEDKLPALVKASTMKYVFHFNMRHIDYEDESVRAAWDAFYGKPRGETIRCLVTGNEDEPQKNHNKLHLYGGVTFGAPLIGVNKESFTSYGRKVEERAADVGKYSAFAYFTALSALLMDSKHNKLIGGDTLVYWADKNGEVEEEFFANLFDPPETDIENELNTIAKRMAEGAWANGIQADRLFYLLCLSPNAGRISVRFFHVAAFGDIIRNIQSHHLRMDVVCDGKSRVNLVSLKKILAETTEKNDDSYASPLIGGQLLQCILTDTTYPIALYHAILLRIRAGGDINSVKSAIVKAVLIKNFGEREVTTVALNEGSNIKAYVLGRLFSVLEQLQVSANRPFDQERLQEDASKSSDTEQMQKPAKIRTTIRNRYFASACANPRNVFPTLLSLSTHHSAKLGNDAFFVYFEKLKGDLLERIDVETSFPAALSLRDQGQFILGYYHQKQWFYDKKKKEEVSGNE